MPDDMKFFSEAGFSDGGIIVFGVMHIIGGVLLISKQTRMYGAIIVAVCFTISTVLIFNAGNIAFAAVSTLSVLLAVFAIVTSVVKRKKSMFAGS